MEEHQAFEHSQSAITRSNDGTLIVERERNTGGWTVSKLAADGEGGNVEFFSMSRTAAEAFVVGYDLGSGTATEPLNGVYLVHREEEDEPLWAFEHETDAEIVVSLLERQGTTAWTSFQPIAYTLIGDDGIRDAIGYALGGKHAGLMTEEGAWTAKLDELINAAIVHDLHDADDEAAKAAKATLDEFFGEEA